MTHGVYSILPGLSEFRGALLGSLERRRCRRNNDAGEDESARGARGRKEREQEQAVQYQRHAAPLRLATLDVGGGAMLTPQFGEEAITLRHEVAQRRVAVTTSTGVHRLQIQPTATAS